MFEQYSYRILTLNYKNVTSQFPLRKIILELKDDF